MKKINIAVVIPIVLIIIFSVFNVFEFYRNGDLFFFDVFMRMSKGPEERKDIVLVDIDDLSIAKVGMYPWTRDIIADGLILLKELGASYAVFDIEFTEESARGVNGDYLRTTLPALIEKEFDHGEEGINSRIIALFSAIYSGSISVKDASEYVEQLTMLNEESKKRILEAIAHVARDNDSYLGQAARFFANAIFTVNMLAHKEEEYSKEHKNWVKEHLSIPLMAENNVKPLVGKDIRPAIAPIARNAMMLGFTNMHVDPDGVRRRVKPFGYYDGAYYIQLGFAPVYDMLGRPEIDYSKSSILLKHANIPGVGVKDIKIPLDPDGFIVVNWPRKDFDNSFTHLSYYNLVLHKDLEKRLAENLAIMDEAGYLKYYQGDTPLLDLYNYAESVKEDVFSGGDVSDVETYRQVRDYFFDEVYKFLSGPTRETLEKKIDEILARDDISEEQKSQYREIKQSVTDTFKKTEKIAEDIVALRKKIKDIVEGAICYQGWTGTATTDRGINPLDKTYDNVGTHASVANTILQEAFIDILPLWLSILLTVILVFAYYYIKQSLEPLASLVAGLLFILITLAAALLLFNLTGLYFPVFTPVVTLIFSFISLTAYNFITTAQERSFIKDTFGQYLSDDVINVLLDNPEMRNLGGQKRYMTAVFTDVKGFSTISEKMDPTDLVTLLNKYLTCMSDIIIELGGTIDKYEGDAIISFFGAPIYLEDHASRACLSAIRMKRAEDGLNKAIMAEGLSPSPLLTRIGVNTGDMVVGNMGTEKKKNYTIMGNAVNLAARLEGVNKRYGSWILISQDTYENGGRNFAARMLDRVRVVGINTPVRLYQLIEEKDRITPDQERLIKLSEEGLMLLEDRKYKEAEKVFMEALKIAPDDPPVNFFIDRARNYQKNPPPSDWDGVYKLTEK
ncbi:adenylate/guanylate cyclase domain-containing protein [Spirochaetia bacterium 38H-sp]|uniref:Adenylate/guanylate cyclase domain-containing protein n=1 Tax=Rarispira pelagica TaxID=3141764 RepID=A0ABU9UDL6_9SPIR